MTSEIDIRFYIGGKIWAEKLWHAVPRVGDEVMLGAGRHGEYKADAAGKAPFRVTRVVWGTEGPNDRHQCASLEVEPIA